MPDSVKISELTPRTALEGDVLPAVDSTFSATVRVTAASIAAIGGGPPADNSVSTVKIQNGAVTYPKIQDVTADSVLGRTSSGDGVVEELACTALARELLAASTPLEARDVIDALAGMDNPDFRGQVRLQAGSAAAPSLSMGDYTTDPFVEDLNTGIFFPYPNAVGISTDGKLQFYIDSEGLQYSTVTAGSETAPATIMPQYGARAWVAFDGLAGGAFTIRNQAVIAQRYQRANSLWYDGPTGNTVERIKLMESLRGANITSVGTAAADGRSNYTTPGDNVHWYYDPVTASWKTIAASGRTWIGNITISSANTYPILDSANISSVTSTSTGVYVVKFLTPMPDTNYAVVLGQYDNDALVRNTTRVSGRTTTQFEIHHWENGVAVNTNYFAAAVFR